MSIYHNDIDHFCCAVIRARIADGRLPAAHVDERSIVEVQPDDVRAYTICHWFAGIAGFELARLMAGWPGDLPLWTGGFPCQDISCAGKGEGIDGSRSGLWWEWLRLIRACRPARLLIENVAALRTRGADAVLDALEGEGYACRPIVVGACHVGAPHRRGRVWIVADRDGDGCDGTLGDARAMGGALRAVEGGEPEPSRIADSASLNGSLADHDGSRQQQPRGRVAKLGGWTGNGGEAMADSAARGLGADGRIWGGEGHADERGENGLAHANGYGLRAGWWTEAPDADEAGACRWPARRGEPQHEWEPPRLLRLPQVASPMRRFFRADHPAMVECKAALHAEAQRLEAAASAVSVDLMGTVGRNAHGLSSRLAGRNKDALRATGNAIVPQCAAAILRAWLLSPSPPCPAGATEARP